MEIIDHFRARVLNSSTGAFNLALKNTKYFDFAEKLISVKNQNAETKFKKQNASILKTQKKTYKYNYYLNNIRSLRRIESRNAIVSLLNGYDAAFESLKKFSYTEQLEILNSDTHPKFFIDFFQPQYNEIKANAEEERLQGTQPFNSYRSNSLTSDYYDCLDYMKIPAIPNDIECLTSPLTNSSASKSHESDHEESLSMAVMKTNKHLHPEQASVHYDDKFNNMDAVINQLKFRRSIVP